MILIYDNGGKTMDRYTILSTKHKTRRGNDGRWLYEGMFSGIGPRGMSGHCETTRGRHLGKRVELSNLPTAVNNMFTQFIHSLEEGLK